MELLGRDREQKTFKHCLGSSESKLVALYGRRRVGKTFLIRNYFEGKMRFEISGLKGGDINDQLIHWSNTLAKSGYYPASIATPRDWMGAFEQLSLYIDSLKDKSKKVIFIDELPWFDTPRSKFLMAFENFWNSYCTKRSDILLIICGSAASWMLHKILKNKGGLHNRVSEKISLQPFTLLEVQKFLKYKGITWSNYDIIQLYLTTGGIPYYIDAIRKGESVVQFIDRVCFNKDGALYHEYEELYSSLFDNSQNHYLVISLLSDTKQGLPRDKIIEGTRLRSGGTLSKVLDELEQSGFIKTVLPFGANKNGKLYKLDDYFTLFYFKFMINKGKRSQASWASTVTSPAWYSWSGLAFERLCGSHLPEIKKEMGLEVIQSETFTWANKAKDGAQIDLIIDRADRVANVCEIKFSKAQFTIDKDYAMNLRNKMAQFAAVAKKRSLFLTVISPFGVVDNEYCKELVQTEVTMEAFFK